MLDEYMEDIQAMVSPKYIKLIKEARNNYKKKNVKK